jgi:hypothetical protein
MDVAITISLPGDPIMPAQTTEGTMLVVLAAA